MLVTKADLFEPEQIQVLVRRLRELNPSATVSVTACGELLWTETAGAAGAGLPPAKMPEHVDHTSGISTLELVTDEPLNWQAFSVWLSLLLHRHGPEVLRVKGVLDVRGVGPVALSGCSMWFTAPST